MQESREGDPAPGWESLGAGEGGVSPHPLGWLLRFRPKLHGLWTGLWADARPGVSPAQPLTCWMTLGKSLYLSVPVPSFIQWENEQIFFFFREENLPPSIAI